MTDDELPVRVEPRREQAPDSGFTPLQLATWAGFLRTHSRVTRSLSAALERDHGLTINEFEVLLFLSQHEGVRLSELARRVNLSPSGMTGMINRLARTGLIRRCTSQTDARAGYLELTDAGRDSFHQACSAHVARVQSEFLGRFDDDEQQRLVAFWARFAGHATD